MDWSAMPDHSEGAEVLYLLDTSTISEIFRSYYRDRFPSLWTLFDALVTSGGAVSVRAVQRELEVSARGEVTSAVPYLRGLASNFFSDPGEQEQVLVREMFNSPNLSSANTRWATRATGDREDADPYLIAKARVPSGLWARQIIVTQESPTNPAGIPAVCQTFSVPCINLQQMMVELGWQF